MVQTVSVSVEDDKPSPAVCSWLPEAMTRCVDSTNRHALRLDRAFQFLRDCGTPAQPLTVARYPRVSLPYTTRDSVLLVSACSLGSVVTWRCFNVPGGLRQRAPAHAIGHALSSKEPCGPKRPGSRRWACLPRPPFPASPRLRFCQLAKRFAERAFSCLSFPLTQDLVSCDYP